MTNKSIKVAFIIILLSLMTATFIPEFINTISTHTAESGGELIFDLISATMVIFIIFVVLSGIGVILEDA